MLTKYIANKMLVRKLQEKRCLLVDNHRFFEEKYIETEDLDEEFQFKRDLDLVDKEIFDLDEGLLVLYQKIKDFEEQFVVHQKKE